jgi:hypothetical protein
MRRLTRYWVARYAAYPVLWTTAQESDKDFYGQFKDLPLRDPDGTTSPYRNPWQQIMAWVREFDPYRHPLTAHQENTGVTRASDSAFREIPGHSWFAMQWAVEKSRAFRHDVPRDYWNNSAGRPVVYYEGGYDLLWAKEENCRLQGYAAMLSGMAGSSYGAAGIWQYQSGYDMEKDTVTDGDTITVEEKRTTWDRSAHLPAAEQKLYFRRFFEELEWWKLKPQFDCRRYVRPLHGKYVAAAIGGNRTLLVYFYNTTRFTGFLGWLKPGATYHARWFNPKTGEYRDIGAFRTRWFKRWWTIPCKPDGGHWMLSVALKSVPSK